MHTHTHMHAAQSILDEVQWRSNPVVFFSVCDNNMPHGKIGCGVNEHWALFSMMKKELSFCVVSFRKSFLVFVSHGAKVKASFPSLQRATVILIGLVR